MLATTAGLAFTGVVPAAAATTTGAASPIAVTGLTVNKSYQCRVNATNSRGTGPFSLLSTPINA